MLSYPQLLFVVKLLIPGILILLSSYSHLLCGIRVHRKFEYAVNILLLIYGCVITNHIFNLVLLEVTYV